MFAAGSSLHPDGAVVRYVWSFGDHKKLTTTKPIVSHKYKKPGRYTVRLTVSAAGSTSSVTHKIKVKR